MTHKPLSDLSREELEAAVEQMRGIFEALPPVLERIVEVFKPMLETVWSQIQATMEQIHEDHPWLFDDTLADVLGEDEECPDCGAPKHIPHHFELGWADALTNVPGSGNDRCKHCGHSRDDEDVHIMTRADIPDPPDLKPWEPSDVDPWMASAADLPVRAGSEFVREVPMQNITYGSSPHVAPDAFSPTKIPPGTPRLFDGEQDPHGGKP